MELFHCISKVKVDETANILVRGHSLDLVPLEGPPTEIFAVLLTGGFRAARLPGQVTRTAEPQTSFCRILQGNARACPGLEPPLVLPIENLLQ